MAFSFADLGFWRLAAVTFILELLHVILESHWPGIRGSRLGPRPLGAILFMFAEVVALGVAVAAAIGTIEKMFRLPVRPTGQISVIVLAVIGVVAMFFLAWLK